MHHLRDGLGREAESFDETCLNDGDSLFGQAIDGLKIFLDRWMEAVRHAGSLPAALRVLSNQIAPVVMCLSEKMTDKSSSDGSGAL